MMSEKTFYIMLNIDSCSKCVFLNSSDVGENCNLLKYSIQEDEWSNINYQFDKGWKYKGCPLEHPENLRESANVIRVEEFVEWDCDSEG